MRLMIKDTGQVKLYASDDICQITPEAWRREIFTQGQCCKNCTKQERRESNLHD